MDPELLRIGTKAALVYAFFLLLVRLAGKREIGHFSAFDFVVALILGDISDNVIFGEVELAEGGVAAVVLMLVHSANSWLSYRSAWWHKLVSGTPTVIVRDGKVQPRGLRAERMHPDELHSHLRECEIQEDELEDVALATVEPDGRFTVIRRPEAQSARRRDVGAKSSD
jgi:uncharacterized membrane protein YcaP (DUF421 family)